MLAAEGMEIVKLSGTDVSSAGGLETVPATFPFEISGLKTHVLRTLFRGPTLTAARPALAAGQRRSLVNARTRWPRRSSAGESQGSRTRPAYRSLPKTVNRLT